MSENPLHPVEHLTDQELLTRTIQLARGEARVTALLVAHLAEIDARRLYLSAGFPSLFAYCVRELHLSEAAAYRRITAARVARRFPMVLDLIARGAIHLAALSIVGPLLTPENHDGVLRGAIGLTYREAEEFATLWRSPGGVGTAAGILDTSSALPGLFDAPQAVETSSEGNALQSMLVAPGGEPAAPASPTIGVSGGAPRQEARPPIEANGAIHDPAPPIAPARSRLVLQARPGTRRLLFEARDLLRHSIPDGDLDSVLSRALELLLRSLRARKYGERRGRQGPSPAAAPRDEWTGEAANRTGVETDAARGSSWPSAGPGSLPREVSARNQRSRYLPVAVRREVWRRDGARCAFRSNQGRRCEATARLEFHHRIPFARGGPSTPENIELRCRAHNQYEEPDWLRHDYRNRSHSEKK